MAGFYVPLVMLPRTTTLAGGIASDPGFRTVPMDVTPYAKAFVTAWRGKILGTAPTPPPDPFTLHFEQSSDRDTWEMCPGSPEGDPGEDSPQPYILMLTKRWFRARIELPEADNIVSCWLVGSLEMRRRT